MNGSSVVDFDGPQQRKLAKIQQELADKSGDFEKRNRVHTKDYILMMGTALFFDTLQGILSLIPFAGWILSSMVAIFAWLTFYLWTSIKGWGLSDTVKQFIVQWAIPFVELIPVLNVLPTWTLRVFLQLSFLKAEDALYNASGGRADFENLQGAYKNAAMRSNMTRLQTRSINSGAAEKLQVQRGESNKLFSDEAFNKRRKEREEHFERMRQMGQRQDELRYGGGTKEGLDQFYAKEKKDWDIGTGRARPDKAA